ncbi:hypothetical protein [Actinomycetospora aeridis]|uniref:Uncharacterized protein n=1 Tax=Actinomycetospora aeridis TaxID=3129231 RepID=A0ABU8N5Q1_9PSEU
MSTFEDLFVDPGYADVELAARDLGHALGFDVSYGRSKGVFVGTQQLSPTTGHIGGEIAINDYQSVGAAAPEDFSIYDDLPIMWSLWTGDICDGDLREAEQRRRARIVFDLVVERLGWSAVLVHDFEELIATYDPERGVREFPPGTPSNGTGRHLWG